MRETFAHDLGALLCLGEDECALQNRLNEIADAFRAPRRIGRITLFGGLKVARQHFDMFRHAAIARRPDVRMRGIDFLDQRAHQAGVLGDLALQHRCAELDIAEQALTGIGAGGVRRGLKNRRGHRLEMLRGRDAKLLLASEVVEEAALRHARGGANIVHRRRRIAFGADNVARGVQQLGSRFGAVVRSRVHH